jgi:hypothetical protein
MPSPNNVSELVIFAGLAIVVVIGLLIASRFTNVGKKLTGDWKPGPMDLNTIERPLPPRQKYVDPLANIKMHYVILSIIILMAIAFIYYFATKSTWQSGN